MLPTVITRNSNFNLFERNGFIYGYCKLVVKRYGLKIALKTITDF